MPGARASGRPRPGARARGRRATRPRRRPRRVAGRRSTAHASGGRVPVHPRVQSSSSAGYPAFAGSAESSAWSVARESLGCAVSRVTAGARAAQRAPCELVDGTAVEVVDECVRVALEGKGAHGRRRVRERVELLAEGLVERRSPEGVPAAVARLQSGCTSPSASERRARSSTARVTVPNAERAAAGRSASSSPSESLRASTPDPRCDTSAAAGVPMSRPSAVSRPAASRASARALASSCQRSSSVGVGAVGAQVRTRTHKHRCDARRSAGGRRPRATSPSPTRHVATSRISCSDSSPANAGIAPPPFVTCSTTSSNDGASSSRFGPTEPVEPGLESVAAATAGGRKDFLVGGVAGTGAAATLLRRRRGGADESESSSPPQPAATSSNSDRHEQQREVPTRRKCSARRSSVNLDCGAGPGAQPDEVAPSADSDADTTSGAGELVPDGLRDRAGPAAVDDPHLESRPASAAVSTNARSASRASWRFGLDVELVRRVDRRRRRDRDGLLAGASAAASRSGRAVREVRALEDRRGPRPRRRRHLEDRPADAELGRDDRIAGGSRRVCGSGSSASRSPARARGTIRGGSESAIALTLLRRRGGSGGTPALPLEPARALRGALRAGASAGPRARAIARSRSDWAEARTRSISLELGDPGLCGSARLLCSGARSRHSLSLGRPRPSAASASARSPAMRSRSGVT